LFAKLTIRMAKKMYVIESWNFVAEKKNKRDRSHKKSLS
jgi:hypothetical protein